MLKTVAQLFLLSSLFLFFNIFSNNCSKVQIINPYPNDVEAIKGLMNEQYPAIFYANKFDYTLDTTSYPAFYQEITKEVKVVDSIIFHNTPDGESDFPHARTSLTDTLYGNLHIWTDKNTHSQKTYKAVSKVKGFFEKWGESSDNFRGWVLGKFVAGNLIESDNTISFNTLRITSTGFNALWYPSSITNFLNKDSAMVRFYKGEQVTFKLTPVDTASYFYYLHTGEDGNFHKIPFVNQGDSVLVASWTTTTDANIARGYKHAFISITRRSSIENPSSAYKFGCWGVLYKIR
jgi:hypothetical protein